VDTSIYRSDWRGVAPACEIVVCEFDRPKSEAANEALEAAQPDLFAEAA
jgi:hypothetical protein